MSINYSKKTPSLVDLGGSGELVPFQPQADTLTYEPFFGLNEKPFSLNADPRFVYDSPMHGATRQGLLAGIRRREGLLVLTGEIGTGKTTLCRGVLRDLGRKTYSSLVPDPFVSREDLLKTLLIDFGVLSIQELTAGRLRQASRTELGYQLTEFLDSLPADAFVVVIIDEAQNLSLPLIEEMRILSDTAGADGRLQIIFVGQPELHAKLKLPGMRQVDQRVCGYHHLAPMSRDAVAGYIQHRLQVAGGHPDRVLFPPDVLDVLHRRSGGVPRLINRVCDRALHLAHDRQAASVNREILDAALIEVGSVTLSPTWDSIVFSESPAPAVATTPAPTAPTVAPAVEAGPALPLDDENFEKQIDHWVEKDLAPPSRTLTKLPAVAGDATPERRGAAKTAPKTAAKMGAKRPAPVAIDWPRDRSETYLRRFLRKWVKRAAIAVGVLVGVNLAILGASLLMGLLTPASLPALPEAPAKAVAGIELPQAPTSAEASADKPQPEAPRTEAPPTVAPRTEAPPVAPVAASGDYLVAVGLFASRERADQLVDALTQAGLPAMQRPFRMRRGEVQQIVLGPFFSRAEALADLRRLQALGGYNDASVIAANQ